MKEAKAFDQKIKKKKDDKKEKEARHILVLIDNGAGRRTILHMCKERIRHI